MMMTRRELVGHTNPKPPVGCKNPQSHDIELHPTTIPLLQSASNRTDTYVIVICWRVSSKSTIHNQQRIPHLQSASN